MNTIIINNNIGTVSILLYFPKWLLLKLLMQIILSTVIDLSPSLGKPR